MNFKIHFTLIFACEESNHVKFVWQTEGLSQRAVDVTKSNDILSSCQSNFHPFSAQIMLQPSILHNEFQVHYSLHKWYKLYSSHSITLLLNSYYCYHWHQHLLTRLWARTPRNRGSIPGKGKIFPLQSLEPFWGSPKVLHSGCRGPFPRALSTGGTAM